jgi:hypothetical protein
MWQKVVFNLVLPVLRGVTKLLGRPVDGLERYFVRRNNRSVQRRNIRLEPSELLLLLPHCVQRWECPNKITSTVDNCERCGQCTVDAIAEVAEKYGVALEVATGGGRAILAVNERAPRGIVAVACEREMVDGIRDSLPLPVLGVLNERPEGPCKNTVVDAAKVESAVRWFLNGKP